MASTITERQRINTSSAVKVPCKAATTANLTLSGEQTIDGVACVTNDRVLVKNQTTASENGIYLVDTSGWSRARDWDGAYDVKKGTFVYVTGGTNSGFWYVTTADPIIPGTTSVTIAQASSQLITFSAFAQLLLDDADATAMFNTLGVSSFAQTTLLASMGLSSDMQSFLQAADDAAARAALGAAQEVISRDVTQAEVVNTNVETTVFSTTLPANTLGTNRMLRLTLLGDYLNNSGSSSNFTFRVTFGTTQIVAGSGPALTTHASRRSVRFTSEIAAANSTSAQTSVSRLLYTSGTPVGVTGSMNTGTEMIGGHSSIAEDGTTALALTVAVAHTVVDASTSFRCNAVQVEII